MINASELWTRLRHRNPDVEEIDLIEREVFSTFPVDMREWIGGSAIRLLASIESRAISNGIGAGRGGGPEMEKRRDGCYRLRDDGIELIGADAKAAIRDAGQALRRHTARWP